LTIIENNGQTRFRKWFGGVAGENLAATLEPRKTHVLPVRESEQAPEPIPEPTKPTHPTHKPKRNGGNKDDEE
jgi:hypothetical protein